MNACQKMSEERRKKTSESERDRNPPSIEGSLLFDWFEFNQTSKYVTNSALVKQLNVNKINRRSIVQ